jgi:hypothetical protein
MMPYSPTALQGALGDSPGLLGTLRSDRLREPGMAKGPGRTARLCCDRESGVCLCRPCPRARYECRVRWCYAAGRPRKYLAPKVGFAQETTGARSILGEKWGKG